MRIEQLSYFLEVAKTGSINKAAENLFVTQPGLSDSIKKMESELGLTLLKRSKVGVSLTEDGNTVAKHAVTILAAYQDMLQDLSPVKKAEAVQEETINIATTSLFSASILVDVFRLFRSEQPHVNIRYVEFTESEVIQKVRDGSADLGFFATTENSAEQLSVLNEQSGILTCSKLYQDELVVCLSKRSALAFNKSFPAEVASKENAVTFVSIETPRRDNVIAVSNNISTLIDIIIQGEAISVVPKYAFKRCFSTTKGIISRPIEPKIYASFYVVQRNAQAPRPAVQALMLTIRRHLAELFGLSLNENILS